MNGRCDSKGIKEKAQKMRRRREKEELFRCKNEGWGQ